MPVGTQATVKGLTPQQLVDAGATHRARQHLPSRPCGPATKSSPSWAACTASWPGTAPILTDSGGFQVYSLAAMRKITDHAAVFRSHIDGALLELTPERAVAIQENLGSDIAMCLDECPPADTPPDYLRVAVRAHHPLGRALPGRPSSPRSGPVRHRPGRHRPRPAGRVCRGPGGPGLPRLRPGRLQRRRDRRRRWSPPSSPPPPCCRPTSRATSWASAGRRTSSQPWPAASTCSTASCRPATAAMPGVHRSTGRPPAQCLSQARSRPAGVRLPLLYVPAFQPGLPAPSVSGRRDAGADAAVAAQRRLLLPADGPHPRGDRAGSFRRLRGGLSCPLGGRSVR